MGTLFLTIVLLLALTWPVEGRVVTLDECVHLAVEQSSSLKSYDAVSTAAGEDVTISRTGFLPSLVFKGSYTLYDKSDRLIINGSTFASGVPASDVTVPMSDRYDYSFGLTLRQPLYTGGYLTHGYRRSQRQAVAAEYDAAHQKRLLKLHVRLVFNEVLVAHNQVRSAKNGIRAREERLRVVRERLVEGYTDREEVLRQEAELAMAQARFTRAKSRGELAVTRLKKLIQAEPGEELLLVGSPVMVTLSVDLNDLVAAGLDQREDLKSSEALVLAADEKVGEAKSGFLPQVYLEGGYYRQKETNIALPERWLATVQAEWPLFQWGKTAATVRQAAARRQQQESAREQQVRDLRFEIEERWREVAEQQSLALALEKKVRAVEAALGKSIDRFSTGVARYDEALAEEAGLWDAFDSYYQGVVSLENSLATLETATATDLGNRTVSEPFYLPDFERYENMLRNALEGQRRSANDPSQPGGTTGHSRSTHTLSGGAGGKQDSACHLQLGAFKSRKYAEIRVSAVRPRMGGKRVKVLFEGGLYKVLAGPYGSHSAAKAAATTLGIGEFLVRSNHGP